MEEKVNRSQFALLICISLHFAIVAINHTKPTFQNYTPHSHASNNESATKSRTFLEHGATTRQRNATTQNHKASRLQHNMTPLQHNESTLQYNMATLQHKMTALQHNVATFLNRTFVWSFVTVYELFNSSTEPLNEVTIVTEWHLTHQDAKWNTLLVTLYFLGVVLGSLPAGLLADRFGRRVVMLTCFYCQGALSIGIVYCSSFTLYAVMRTLQGLFVQGLQNSSYTLLIELFPTRWRIAVAWVTEICWTLGLVSLSVVSYWFPHWRQAELLTSLPFIVLSLFYVWFIPESPLWRYTRNKIIDFEFLCDDESHGDSINHYTEEPTAKNKSTGMDYLSPENFVVQHINNPIHSQTMPNIRAHLKAVNDSFTSAKTDVNLSDEFLADNLDSYGSIEDLRISLSSILSEFDLNIEEYRRSMKSYNIELIEDKPNEIPCMQRGNKTEDNEDAKRIPDKARPNPPNHLPLSVSSPPLCYLGPEEVSYPSRNPLHIPVEIPYPTGDITCPYFSSCSQGEVDTVAIARDKLLRQLNKCVWRECCKRKTLDELLVLLEQKRLTRHDVRNVCREIVDNGPIRSRLFIMCYLWFCTSLSYYGVTFSVPALSGDRFHNFCYGAGFEFVFFSVSFFVLSKVGRKVPLVAFYVLSSCLFLFVFFFALHLSACTRTLLVLLGKGTIVGTFFCVFIYCAELFPTPMRGACNGITSLCCRIGSLLSPYFITYAIKLSHDTMLLLIGLLSVLAAIFTLCLPETHHKKLPDTVDDALNLKTHHRSRK